LSHLVQAARLKAAGHEQRIAARNHAVRHRNGEAHLHSHFFNIMHIIIIITTKEGIPAFATAWISVVLRNRWRASSISAQHRFATGRAEESMQMAVLLPPGRCRATLPTAVASTLGRPADSSQPD